MQPPASVHWEPLGSGVRSPIISLTSMTSLVLAKLGIFFFFSGQEEQACGCEGFNRQHGGACGSVRGQLDQRGITAGTVLEASTMCTQCLGHLKAFKIFRAFFFLTAIHWARSSCGE